MISYDIVSRVCEAAEYTARAKAYTEILGVAMLIGGIVFIASLAFIASRR